MMGLVRAPSRSAGMAIGYITVGVLMMIWTGIWYYSMMGQEGVEAWQKYVCMGLFFSGLAITVIGLLVGQIGGSAKAADGTVGAVMPGGQTVAAPQVIPQQPVIVQQPMQQPAQMPRTDGL